MFKTTSLCYRIALLVLFLIGSQGLSAETFYPDVYPDADVYGSNADEFSLATSTAISMDGIFTLTLTGTWPEDWEISEYACSDDVCYEYLYGLEVSTDGGRNWNTVPKSMEPSFWDESFRHTFSDVSDGTYHYRGVTRYYSADTENVYDEIYYSSVHLKIIVSVLGDLDGDGVPNNKDAFPRNAGESADTDGDGLGDVLDIDDDGDQVPDGQDRYPLDPYRSGDLDGDGIDNYVDTDANNDGTPDTIDLSQLSMEEGLSGFLSNGADTWDYSGQSVSSAGDVNGDGIDDVIIGAYRAETSNGTQSGISYVVFGRQDGSHIELSQLASNRRLGFVIYGASDFDHSGCSVSGAGDVNGDGFDDVIVGARQAAPNGFRSGASYVVFGKAKSTNVDLRNLGSGGFVINGASTSDQSGFSVSGAGDINADGLDDVIVGAHFTSPNGFGSGSSYVVFGKTTNTPVELSQLGSGSGDGFVINGAEAGDLAGGPVSDAGDVNGDGLDDVIVGARQAAPNGFRSGASYVVFGKKTDGVVELSELESEGAGGFVINGARASDQAGFSVSGAGDVNGDGLADVIVGTARETNAAAGSGSAYIVFGRAKNTNIAIELSQLETVEESLGSLERREDAEVLEASESGFAVNISRGFGGVDGTPEASENLGFSVSDVGDLNGDGLADVVVGVPQIDIDGRHSAEAYVVFGKTSIEPVNRYDIELFGTGGFFIKGVSTSSESGVSVSGAGDVNGDGLSDVVIGVPGVDTNGLYSGASYVVYGQSALVDLEGVSGEEETDPVLKSIQRD